MPKLAWAFLAPLCLLASITVFWFFKTNLKDNGLMRVLIAGKPSSSDPIEYDFIKHHSYQSLLNPKLVSAYRGPAVSPSLAMSWLSSSDYTEWKFKIREGIKFSNGHQLDAETARVSLSRIIFLLKKSGSKHEIVEKLVGVEDMTDASTQIEGLKTANGELVFKFKVPYPLLLDALSFGLFAIVHKSQFNEKTGEWIVDGPVISGGPYAIDRTTEDEITLRLRSDYPKDLHSPGAAERVIFFFDVNKKNEATIFRGVSAPHNDLDAHMFFGSGPSQILYLFLHSWNLEGTPFSSLKIRKKFRKLVKAEFQNKYGESTASFFPPITPGLAAIQEDKIDFSLDNESKSGIESISFLDIRPNPVPISNFALESVEQAISQLGFTPNGRKNLSIEVLKNNKNPNLKKYEVDVGFYSTGLSIADPASDIRLMFSREGIWLPDSDGRIHSELKKPNISVSAINQAIYDQCIVIPLAHYSVGIWAKNSLDLSGYNTQLPLGELQWIGVK